MLPLSVFAQLNVLISGGFSGPYEQLLPQFERANNIKVITGSGASQGTGPQTIKAQLARGVAADVVIMSREGLSELVALGKIAAGTDVDLAKTPLGIAVRKGAAKPELSTIDAFKRVVTTAKLVVAPASTSGIFLKDDVLPKLGIASNVNLKLIPRGAAAAAMVASNEADIAVMPVSEIVNALGVELVGVIAEEIQLNQIFAAAVVTGAKQVDAAKRLISFLSSQAAYAAIKTGGMEPLARRASLAVMSDAARSELAPTGKLRAGMNLGNTLFMTKDSATGELRGVSVDLMRELASRLGVPVDFVVHETPGDVADAVDKGTWDVAVLAIAQERAKTIAFSPAMSEIEATYLVQQDSPLRTAGQVDASGIRIAALEKAGYELYLTQTLQKATLIRPKSNTASVDLFKARGADALAALKPNLLDWMKKIPESRMVEGNFMIVNHGLSTPRTRLAAAAYLKAFVEEMNASGFIARSIARNGVKGLSAVK